MENTKRVIRLAQQQALSSFSELVDKMLVETDGMISQAMRSAPMTEQRTLSAARAFLREEGRPFRAKIQTNFSAYLERAMETMHTDLRAGLDDIRADKLTLMEDDVMVRQIEVDRVVLRLRDVDQLSLGRINLTIAHLHGVSDVRERENPFRPYLAARALYEAMREMVKDELVSKVLFDHIAGAMANQLPSYYAAILADFEARGLDARLQARPSELTRHQRERLSWQRATEQFIGGGGGGGEAESGADLGDKQQFAMHASMLPKLHALMQKQGMPERSTPADADQFAQSDSAQRQAQGLQDLVWKVFEQRKAARLPRHLAEQTYAHAAPVAQVPQAVARSELDSQLMQFQQTGMDVDGAPATAPLALGEQIGDAAAPDRLTIDLVALVFDYILHDTLLPPAMHKELGRLHVPFLRAAVLEPFLLHEADHPARALLDRLGTLAAGMIPPRPGAGEMATEIVRLIDRLLNGFDKDMAIFAAAERDLDRFVAALLRAGDPVCQLLLDAIDQAEVSAAQSDAVRTALDPLLAPLKIDPRIAAFIDTTWVPVMLRQGGGDAGLLPELIWSAQAKTGAADRAALLRLLPDLVRRVREGLDLLAMPAPLSKAALDQLVAVHMDVLGKRVAPGGAAMGLDWLQLHFAPFAVGAASDAPLPASRAAIDAALAARGVCATVYADPAQHAALPADAEWLMRARPGAGFEARVDGRFVPVRLAAVSARQSAFVFSMPDRAPPLLYLKAALLAGLRDGSLRPLEYAPLFDRAVESMMAGAELLAPA